jgi:hypothetical protein
MPQKELYLLQFAAIYMAELCAGSSSGRRRTTFRTNGLLVLSSIRAASSAAECPIFMRLLQQPKRVG